MNHDYRLCGARHLAHARRIVLGALILPRSLQHLDEGLSEEVKASFCQPPAFSHLRKVSIEGVIYPVSLSASGVGFDCLVFAFVRYPDTRDREQ